MQIGQDKFGMQTMNQSLFSLFHKRMISLEEALGRSQDTEELKQMISNPAAGMQRRPQTH
jgi:twitching motility protein PilT